MKFFNRVSIDLDLDKLRVGLNQVTDIFDFPQDVRNHRPMQKDEFLNLETRVGSIALTKRPDESSDYFRVRIKEDDQTSPNNKGRKDYNREIDDWEREMEYTEIIPEFENTYFKYVLDELNKYMDVGRMLLVEFYPFVALSWHNDHENKIHIPIETNSGCRMVIENESMHIPEGQCWYVETKNYHSFFNGGLTRRVHLIVSVK